LSQFSNPRIYSLLGINNAMSPCSVAHREGTAFKASNSRVNESGIWDKAPQLIAFTESSDLTKTTMPVSGITTGHTHFRQAYIKDISYLVTLLRRNTMLASGTNKYAYFVDDQTYESAALERGVYWWDGAGVSIASITAGATTTIETSAAHGLASGNTIHIQDLVGSGTNWSALALGITRSWTITVTTTTAFTIAFASTGYTFTFTSGICVRKQGATIGRGDYGLAGIGRPINTVGTVAATVDGALQVYANGINSKGGRQEQGVYYYMYTYYDTDRQCESLPSPVLDYAVTARVTWGGQQYSVIYPSLSVIPDATHTVTAGSKRYDSSCKVRFYRSKRTYDADAVYNAPNEFYFIDEVDYKTTLALTTPFLTLGSTTTLRITAHGLGANGTTLKISIYGLTGTDSAVEPEDGLDFDRLNTAISGKVWTATVASADTVTIPFDSSGENYDTAVVTAGNITRMCIDDVFHDEELHELYEGRGTPPPVAVDAMAKFENRMYYFVDNNVWWSSAGRPDEVAQKYTLTYCTQDTDSTYYYGGTKVKTSTLPMMPFLTQNIQAEAKYEIQELGGEPIVTSYAFNGKLYIFTENTTGYIRPSMTSEGIKYYQVRKGIGCISDKTLALTPYGLFGVDRKGVWLMDLNGGIKRLTENRIDIFDSSKDTYVNQNTIQDSFGVWIPDMNEYVWCLVNGASTTAAYSATVTRSTTTMTVTLDNSRPHGLSTYDRVTVYNSTKGWTDELVPITTTANNWVFTYTTNRSDTVSGDTATVYYIACNQQVYQPERDIWGGTYTHTHLLGGCDIVRSSGSSCFLSPYGATTYVYGRSMDKTTKCSLQQVFQFWFGSASLSYVKQEIKHTVVFESVTI
jgi:hypothetical protein